jgi:magnesium transporter
MYKEEGNGHPRRTYNRAHDSSREVSEDEGETHDRTPLIASRKSLGDQHQTYGIFGTSRRPSRPPPRSPASTTSSRKRRKGLGRNNSFADYDQDYDVNNPPSVPTSPSFGPSDGFGDVMLPSGDFGLRRSPNSRRDLEGMPHDAIIDIDGKTQTDRGANSTPPSPRPELEGMHRRRTMTLPVEGDVCFPAGLSEIADEEYLSHAPTRSSVARRRNRRREWPELWVLEEWSRQEKEQRIGDMGAKKIYEPVYVEGRLRPSKGFWHRVEEDLPYRYTYFNEEFESTIHAQTISELVQPGGSFKELFMPDPPELSDESSEEEADLIARQDRGSPERMSSPHSPLRQPAGIDSILSDVRSRSQAPSARASGQATPTKGTPIPTKQKRYGPRPTFWLDVMCPTDLEMRTLCKAFGIHALTSEDIMMQEAREKVELFRHYYFLNYRTFEQDVNDKDYLEPINMYVCVFKYSVITFHWRQIPHPANVRRRIRQLSDYLILSSDWISYAIIDDITDVYQPLIQSIENDVESIDEVILGLLQETDDKLKSENKSFDEKRADSGENGQKEKTSGLDVLFKIGESRKQVMSLYRLLGNKADVIKGFAKRCNEQWDVAPKSEIGLYLGDIQDHILTMTSSLNHYETLLSRAHSNYLAQINIRMNERSEKSADILGKLTVVGTIVLPMNIICSMWGMNIRVPGQDIDNLVWFWSSKPPMVSSITTRLLILIVVTAGLIVFAITCFYYCKRAYGII